VRSSLPTTPGTPCAITSVASSLRRFCASVTATGSVTPAPSLQLALAAVPLVIAGAGLATAVGAESFAEVVARTVVTISPGSSDELLRQVLIEGGAVDEGSERGEVVVILGLSTAFLAATSAFAQLERGANRIYGTERDRPSLRKYGRAMVLTTTAGVAMAIGLLCIVAGDAFGEAIEQVYRWGDAAETVWDVLRWPLGLGALVAAVTALFRYAPRRRQPGLSWLAVGAGVTVEQPCPRRFFPATRGVAHRDGRPAAVHRGDP
jgi:uncharacterized BrkB/YihY/UPF0761 family membrane protein